MYVYPVQRHHFLNSVSDILSQRLVDESPLFIWSWGWGGGEGEGGISLTLTGSHISQYSMKHRLSI